MFGGRLQAKIKLCKIVRRNAGVSWAAKVARQAAAELESNANINLWASEGPSCGDHLSY